MTSKAEFNAEEWDKIVEGPAIAGLIVISAQRGGSVREAVQMAKVYSETREQHGDSDLLGEIVSSPPSVDQREFESVEALRTEGMNRIRDSVALLEIKGDPDEVDAYKRFTLQVAERAAQATKSGGVLGIGGERVSEAESAALDEIASTLGIERGATPEAAGGGAGSEPASGGASSEPASGGASSEGASGGSTESP